MTENRKLKTENGVPSGPRYPARQYTLAPPGAFYLPLRDCHGWWVVTPTQGAIDGPYKCVSLVETLCSALNAARNLAVELDRDQRGVQRSVAAIPETRRVRVPSGWLPNQRPLFPQA